MSFMFCFVLPHVINIKTSKKSMLRTKDIIQVKILFHLEQWKCKKCFLISNKFLSSLRTERHKWCGAVGPRYKTPCWIYFDAIWGHLPSIDAWRLFENQATFSHKAASKADIEQT